MGGGKQLLDRKRKTRAVSLELIPCLCAVFLSLLKLFNALFLIVSCLK